MVVASGVADPVTEVRVAHFEGLPADSMLSIRAGGFRRQRFLDRCSEPLMFRSSACAAQPLQVDVLVPIATGQLGRLGSGEHRMELHPMDLGKTPSSSSSGASNSRARRASESTDPMNITLQVREAVSLAMPDGPPGLALAQQYMDDHMLKDRLTHVLTHLLRERPDDPLRYLSNAFNGDAGVAASPLPAPASPPPKPSPPPEDDGIAEESLHVLPACVAHGVPTRVLDLGSGETGFYVYQMDAEGKRLAVRSSKRREPFFASFVEPWCVSTFCDALIEEFELQADESSEVAVYAGATGIHRELLMGKRHGSVKAKRFVQEAQAALSERLGGKPAKIWLFVPSGLLEAQLELYATEWLVGHASLFNDGDAVSHKEHLPEALVRDAFQKLDKNGSGRVSEGDLELLISDTSRSGTMARIASKLARDWSKVHTNIGFDEFESSFNSSEGLRMVVQTLAFSGTISAGGGSCQMAMMSGSSMPSLQLFTVPVGNRVPLVEGEFSKPVLPGERETWRGRVRAELSGANFPRGVRGLYIGISATFHAVKAVGLSERLVSRNATVAALEAALERLDPEDQRAVANLTLVHELLQWVFDEDACFVFKRTWKIEEDDIVATWSLGLFTQQHQALMAEQAPHRRKPGPVAKTRVQPLACTVPLDRLSTLSADKLFEVPFVAWPLAPSYLLDIGSGEIGLYVYEADLVQKHVKARRHTKIPEPFYEGFVVKGRVQDFTTVVLRELGIKAGSEQRREVIAGGTTGLHRQILLSDQEKRDEIFQFVGQVEVEMSRLIGRQTVIRIFVPSGELEAQFELRGVEWLIGQASIDVRGGAVHGWMAEKAFGCLSAAGGADGGPASSEIGCVRARLKALGIHEGEAHAALHRADADKSDTLEYGEFCTAVREEITLQALVRRCCFCGTISAGGGSSQLTLTGCIKNSMAQMFSMPVGNRLPIAQRLFSTSVTWEERGDWVERIQDGLRSSHFPQGVDGFFVGISAMYHAAKAAGIAERIVPKQEAMKAFADALSKLDPSDHRSVANLTLVQEIIRWVFDDERSCFLFKRNWSAHGTSYVAGWTLGWYVTQFEADAEVRERSVCNIQRRARGAQARKRLLEQGLQPKLTATRSG